MGVKWKNLELWPGEILEFCKCSLMSWSVCWKLRRYTANRKDYSPGFRDKQGFYQELWLKLFVLYSSKSSGYVLCSEILSEAKLEDNTLLYRGNFKTISNLQWDCLSGARRCEKDTVLWMEDLEQILKFRQNSWRQSCCNWYFGSIKERAHSELGQWKRYR